MGNSCIAPGMSAKLGVRFHASSLSVFDDAITVITEEDAFQVKNFIYIMIKYHYFYDLFSDFPMVFKIRLIFLAIYSILYYISPN